MHFYFLIIMSDIFMATTFGFQKMYQKSAGTSIIAGLAYNILMGFFSACMFLVINRFHIEVTPYSIVMAVIFSVVSMLYIFIGFKIIEKGNMSLYTIFLMSGGMTVPYIWGVAFLNEELTLMRTVGLLLIISATIISGTGIKKSDKKQILMCIAIFFLNGMSSVVSKTHQISPVSEIVTASDFAFIVMLSKVVICSVILLIINRNIKDSNENNLHFKSIAPIVFAAAVFDGIAYMLQLICATKVPVTVLYPLVTGISIILTSLVGKIFFKEHISKKQYIGIAVCFVGTLLFL